MDDFRLVMLPHAAEAAYLPPAPEPARRRNWTASLARPKTWTVLMALALGALGWLAR